MKKRLEAELISIAHRILKLKNKSEVDQLYKESKKLYETLTILKFYQENFEAVKSDLKPEVLEEKLAVAMEEKTPVVEETEAVIEPTIVVETKKETEAPVVEEIPEVVDESFEDNDLVSGKEQEDHEEDTDLENTVDEPAFTPMFELHHEEEEEENEPEVAEPEIKKVKIETFLGDDYVDPVFVKPEEVSLFSQPRTETVETHKSTSNDSLSTGIAIGLNDRIGFVKHLFDDSNEDFNRVLSQLNTFDNFEEAKNFINEMVKPDYNNWEGVEDYEERFMEVVEKKFQ